jgi:acetylornithine aminotransferase/4-aminobutyrate aminotransferase
MLIEPIQGEAGYIPANTRFMKGLEQRCREHGILLIMDEVQSGNGRTGKQWAYEHFDITPDVVVSAKGVASGFPLSFVAAPSSIMRRALPGSQGGTYGGNAVACAAALATLDVMEEENLIENAAQQGARLKKHLKELRLRQKAIGAVTGKGLMIGTHLVDENGKPDGERAGKMLKALEKRGLLMIKCGPWGGNVVRWIPPLIVTQEEIDWAVEQFELALEETA